MGMRIKNVIVLAHITFSAAPCLDLSSTLEKQKIVKEKSV